MQHEVFSNSFDSKTSARLFPVGKDANNERGITSIFLATISVVKAYASGVLNTIGRKTGARTKIECHTEVIFPQDKGDDRPDGLIILRNGNKVVWSALIEAKIGNSELCEDQISRYLELAKSQKIDAVITISNQFAVLPTHHPIKVSKKLTRTVDLYHWSWKFLRTQADHQMRIDEDIDPNQKYILEEMIRYFDHKSSGVQTFDRMNKEWRNVCVKVKNQEPIDKESDEIKNTVSAWHQEQRDIALMLTRKLGAPVTIKLSNTHKSDPEKRIKDDINFLCNNESLICHFDIHRAPSILFVEASLKHRTITCSMEIRAPGDKKTSKARVNWVVRQFAKINPDGIKIGAKWTGGAKITWKELIELRENPGLIQTDNKKLVPHRFIVKTILDLAGKFSGPLTFIEGLENSVAKYYHTVGENLSPWVAPAPKFEDASDIEVD